VPKELSKDAVFHAPRGVPLYLLFSKKKAVMIEGLGDAKSGSDSKPSLSCGLGSFRKPSVDAEKSD